MAIPLRTALIGEQSGAEIGPERLIVLDQPRQSVTFEGVTETPLRSTNRDFSAPVVLTAERRPGELERLAQADTDPFARYEAMQELMFAALTASARGESVDAEAVIRAIGATLKSNALDPAFKAEAILLPSETLIAERMEVVDPDAIHAAREALRAAIGSALSGELLAAHRCDGVQGHDLSPRAKGVRRLRTVALSMVSAADESQAAALAKAQFDGADNMTDRQGALGVLVSTQAPERAVALDSFYARFHDNPLVLDKWFALQAAAQRSDTVDQVLKLAQHAIHLATSSATWLAARLSAGPTLAAVPSAGAVAVKRRVSTRLPPAVDSDPS